MAKKPRVNDKAGAGLWARPQTRTPLTSPVAPGRLKSSPDAVLQTCVLATLGSTVG